MNEPMQEGNAKASNGGSPSVFSRWWKGVAAEPMKTREKVIGIILLIVFLFVFYLTLDANKYRTLVHVIEGEGKVGINPTAEALDFGDLSRGTSAVRRVAIRNGTFMPMHVISWRTGGIADLIKVDKNFFTMKPGEETKIEFTVYMPASAPIETDYTGRVFLFKIPTFGL